MSIRPDILSVKTNSLTEGKSEGLTYGGKMRYFAGGCSKED